MSANVDKTSDIPSDFYGVMGVPITFMDKYNPRQFEILNCCEPCIDINVLRKRDGFKEYPSRQKIHNGELCQKTYHRILIRRRQVSQSQLYTQTEMPLPMAAEDPKAYNQNQ